MDDNDDLDLSALQQSSGATPAGQPASVPKLKPFTSPVYDLRHPPQGPPPTAAQGPIATPNNPLTGGGAQVVKIGEETIQIAPHPTTNRFPWAPVDNPRVPVYQVTPLPAAPAPAPVPPPPPPQPTPPPTEPQVALPAPITPPPAPVQPPPPPKPPVPTSPPMPPPPLAPVPEPKMPDLPQPKPPKPSKISGPTTHQPVQIYSHYTREVWGVLRAGRSIRILYVVIFLVLLIGGYGAWFLSGTSGNIMDIPFLHELLHSQ